MDKIQGGVGFFDSGIGGLTVLAECKKHIHDQVFYYYGDNAHAPYGNLPERVIEKYVFSAFDTFAELKVESAVIACNTATAVCVEKLRKTYPFPIIGAEPALLPAVKEKGDVFVLTTRATYESLRFQNLCDRARKKYPLANVTAFPCDNLAGEIERNLFTPNYDYTPFLPKGNPTHVVLGCTHYIYLKSQIARFYNCKVIDGNEGIAKRLKYFLDDISVKNRNSRPLSTTTLDSPANSAPVFFIGGQKNTNEHVFEQMFAK